MKIADLRVGQIVAFGHRESDHGPADETWTVVDLDLRRGVVTLAPRPPRAPLGPDLVRPRNDPRQGLAHVKPDAELPLVKRRRYRCSACARHGHNARTCPFRRHCGQCGRAGHTKRACPNAWRAYLYQRPS